MMSDDLSVLPPVPGQVAGLGQVSPDGAGGVDQQPGGRGVAAPGAPGHAAHAGPGGAHGDGDAQGQPTQHLRLQVIQERKKGS